MVRKHLAVTLFGRYSLQRCTFNLEQEQPDRGLRLGSVFFLNALTSGLHYDPKELVVVRINQPRSSEWQGVELKVLGGLRNSWLWSGGKEAVSRAMPTNSFA